MLARIFKSGFDGPSSPGPEAQIDTIGWLFAAFVVGTAAIAAMAVWDGNETTAVNTTVSQVAGPVLSH